MLKFAFQAASPESLSATFDGYLMHMGRTEGIDRVRPFARFSNDIADGAHGLFSLAEQRGAWAKLLGIQSSRTEYATAVDQALDDIAAQLEACLDIDGLMAIAR